MTISKRSLPRRTVPRGLGVSLSLPLLDAASPALIALAKPLHRFQATRDHSERLVEQV